MTTSERTKRADILLKVLDCINRNAYEEWEEFWVFGGDLNDLLRAERGDESEELDELKRFGDTLGRVIADANEERARTLNRRLMSVDSPSEGKSPAKVPDRADRVYASLKEHLDRELGPPHDLPSTLNREYKWDLLDDYYAKEVLGKLTRIVRRASGLDNLDIQGIPNERVKRYFIEAHRCYAYGFPLGCAALCRAIIESALREAIDLRETLKDTGKIRARNEGVDAENLASLIKRAGDLGILTETGCSCAGDVRTAGNWAIHPEELENFHRRYGTEGVGGVVANTRKVLAELYGQAELK